MINCQEILIVNTAAVLLLLTMLGSTKRSIRHSFPDDRLFYVMAASTLVGALLETLVFCADGRGGGLWDGFSLAAGVCLYLVGIAYALLWTMYADYKVFADTRRLRRIYPFVAVPAMLAVIACIMNLFTPIFFRVTVDGIYERTSLVFIPYALSYLYIAYGIALIYKFKNRVNRYLFLPAFIYMLPVLLASLVQLTNYGVSATWLGTAVALVAIYVNLQDEVGYTDCLSGLLTRQYMEQYLDIELNRPFPRRKLAGIMMDVDQFKQTNDAFGHLMGDDAIRSIGGILRACVPPKAIAVRYAGDEFVILMQVDDEAQLYALKLKLERALEEFNAGSGKPYSVWLSMGCSVFYRERDTLDSFFSRMDAAMYDEKRARFESHSLPDRRRKTVVK